MKSIIMGLLMAGLLASVVQAQTTPNNISGSPASDSGRIMADPIMGTNGFNGGMTNGADVMRRGGTNAPAWGREGTPPGAWQRSTNAPAWRGGGQDGRTGPRSDTGAGASSTPLGTGNGTGTGNGNKPGTGAGTTL